MSRYKWVWEDLEKRKRLYNVGILPDGTLHNPNGYPEEMVRAAVLAADQRRHEHKSQAAKKAAATRQERQQLKVHIVALRAAAGQGTGPRHHCYVCGRALEDPQSIARGIGSECWQDVLGKITAARNKAEAGKTLSAKPPGQMPAR